MAQVYGAAAAPAVVSSSDSSFGSGGESDHEYLQGLGGDSSSDDDALDEEAESRSLHFFEASSLARQPRVTTV